MTISLAQFNPAADAQQVFDGVMAAGSPILQSASGKFAAGDVGKMIHVQGAGTARLKLVSTIASYQSPTQVTLADAASFAISPTTASQGSGVTWGTDDGPVFQAAIDAIDNGEDLYVPAGNYLLSTPVYRDYAAVGDQSCRRLRMYGDGFGTRIYAAAYNPTTSTSHQGVTLISLIHLQDFQLSDMLFVGTPCAKVDFQVLLLLSQCIRAHIDADFYWLSPLGPIGGGGAVIWSFASHLRLNSRFRGCIGGDIIWNSTWRGFIDEGSIFIDWGILDGFYSTKYLVGTPNSWIRIDSPAQSDASRTDAFGQSKVVIRNTMMDEDGGVPILINAPAGSIREAEIDGVRINAPATVTPSIKISGVRFLSVNAYVGYNTTVVNNAIELSNIEIATLKQFKADALSNVIVADSSVGTLILEDCEYTTLNSSAGQTIIVSEPSPNAVYTVSSLPSPTLGSRAFVSDSTAGLTTGIGNIVAGGGSDFVPVYGDGSDWLIG
jgi:hypothetical protein